MTCNDLKGPTTLKLSVATNQGKIFVFNTTGPAAEYSHAASALEAMVRSMHLQTGATSRGTPAGADPNKAAALEEACATGVFTPEECAQKRAALEQPGNSQQPSEQGNAPGPSESGPNANPNFYHDPQGRFQVAIPQGWTADPQGNDGSQGVKLSSGSNWAFIGPFGGATNPADVVVKLATQIQSQYRNFSMTKHAPLHMNGHNAEYAAFTGTNPQGARVALMIAGIAAAGGNHLGMLTSSPFAAAGQTTPVFTAMFNSIRFAGEGQ